MQQVRTWRLEPRDFVVHPSGFVSGMSFDVVLRSRSASAALRARVDSEQHELGTNWDQLFITIINDFQYIVYGYNRIHRKLVAHSDH